MIPSPACAALVREFEGCARKLPDGRYGAYPDPGTGGAPWTIGWGSTGADVHAGLIWTQAQCDARLATALDSLARAVTLLIGEAPTAQHQFDALVSLAYNIGTGHLAHSALLAKHKAGNHAGAAAEFARWNRAGGWVAPGLARRRAAEAELYGRTA